MSDAIKSSLIVSMAETLDLRELGAATRILARLVEKKGPIPVKTAHLVAGVSKEEWDTIKEDILVCFSHNETEIALTDALLSLPTVATEPRKVRAGKTVPLFPENPKGHQPEKLPSYLAKRPKTVTLRQAIYDTGIRLLMGQNMTERTARGILSNLLTSYPAGDIAEVLEKASREKTLEDPHSWVVAQLRTRAKNLNIQVRQNSDGGIVRAPVAGRPQAGMTEQTIDAIRKRNQQIAQRKGLFDSEEKAEGAQDNTSQQMDSITATTESGSGT